MPRLSYLDLSHNRNLSGTLPEPWAMADRASRAAAPLPHAAGHAPCPPASCPAVALQEGRLPASPPSPRLTTFLCPPLRLTHTSAQLTDLKLAGNSLSGPLIPKTWTQKPALPQLSNINLSGNARLAGTLPPELAWPMLVML